MLPVMIPHILPCIGCTALSVIMSCEITVTCKSKNHGNIRSLPSTQDVTFRGLCSDHFDFGLVNYCDTRL